jgi:hypothetical protein
MGTLDSIIEDNVVIGGNFGVATGSSSNITVRRNVMRDQNLATWAAGFHVDPQIADAVGVVVEDNVMINCSRGVGINADAGHTVGATITHNTIVDPLIHGIYADAPFSGTVQDNIVDATVAPTSMLTISDPTGTVTLDHNVYFGGAAFSYDGTGYATLALYKAGSGKDADASAADPLLTRRYRLGAGSPAIGTASDGGDKGVRTFAAFPALWTDIVANPVAGASRAGEAATHAIAFDAIEALVDKLGTGPGEPQPGTVLIGTGIGSSSWVSGIVPTARQDITGSRGANAALASLLTALEDMGLITDSSS